MKPFSKRLLTLVTALGFAFGSLGSIETAQAATPKKKVVAGKKVAKPASRIVKKKAKAKVTVASGRMAANVRKAQIAAAPAFESDGVTPRLASSAVVVIDQSTGNVLFEKNANQVVPIASITKLMTAMVVLDAQPSLSEVLTITAEDLDTLKGTSSRLRVGTQLSREEMLRLALMSSENRASAALSRFYPGGRTAFIAAMNLKSQALGLSDTRFADPTGLTPHNVSSARDLVKLVDAAHQYPLIREFSTSEEYHVDVRGREQIFRNTNALVRNDGWNIGLSKTGYISEAGKCLVMQAWFDNKPMIIVLLDSWGKFTRIGDAQRIKHWLEAEANSRAMVRG
ncbi:MAG: D-alanyl-D-alanine endopeptidase [Rhodocyclaceae bacterium]|nr:D-alanyl-D-alanine endopeptidase [Rhodocyclaceae bacterium]MDZ4213513.1 D-alanyl-D-alanine endopeptidase [Rhodocyclaceae bacterium]